MLIHRTMLFNQSIFLAILLNLAWADDNAGFDYPGEPGEANDFSDDEILYVGDIVDIRWHMNFTDALLKLVQTPSNHESASEYIISGTRKDAHG